MKRFSWLGLSLLLVSGLVACKTEQKQAQKQEQQPVQQPDPRLAQIASKVVTVSANVKPGEVVVVSGSAQKLALMQAVAIEAAKAGGRVAPLFVTTDQLQHSYMTDVPEQYLAQPWAVNAWLNNVDVWISTGDTDDSKAVLGDVSASREAKTRLSMAAYREAVNKSKLREVDIGVPNQKDAEYAKVDWTAYQNMLWDAINADYQEISTKGQRLAKLLENGKTIHITTPGGTDITMALGKRTAFVSAGLLQQNGKAATPFLARQTELPGGLVQVAPVETSANGKVVAPKDTCRPYEYLTGANYAFQQGKMTSFSASANADCFQQYIAAYSGDKDRVACVSIGINPSLKVMESGDNDYRPFEAAGMVNIGMGNNALLGGSNKTEFGWTIPQTNATVQIDGTTVVKDGQLAF